MHTCPEQTGDVSIRILSRKVTQFWWVITFAMLVSGWVLVYPLDFSYFLVPIVISFFILYTNFGTRFQMPYLGCVRKNSFIECLKAELVQPVFPRGWAWPTHNSMVDPFACKSTETILSRWELRPEPYTTRMLRPLSDRIYFNSYIFYAYQCVHGIFLTCLVVVLCWSVLCVRTYSTTKMLVFHRAKHEAYFFDLSSYFTDFCHLKYGNLKTCTGVNFCWKEI